jgi:hypothetical protein
LARFLRFARFRFGLGLFFLKKFNLVTFFNKNWTEPKMIT